MSAVIIITALVILAITVLAYVPKKIEPIVATHDEVASAIEKLIDGTGGDHDRDDFLRFPVIDAYLESVREKCEAMFTDHPATQTGQFCGAKGFEVLRQLASDVRSESREPNSKGSVTP